MRLAWVTDPHLNFVPPVRLQSFRDQLLAVNCPILITGDLSDAPNLNHALRTLDTLHHPVYFVLGNHDFYHSSIAQVRAAVAQISDTSEHLRWLPRTGVVELTPDTALVGVDGWADARFGNWRDTTVVLNDFYIIEELAHLDQHRRTERLRSLSDREASALRPLLEIGRASCRERVYVLV